MIFSYLTYATGCAIILLLAFIADTVLQDRKQDRIERGMFGPITGE